MSYPPTTQDLTDFQSFLVQTHAGSNPQITTNKRLVALKTVLKAEAKLGKFELPDFPDQLLVVKVANKIYLPLDHLERLYEACDGLGWPSSGPGRQAIYYSPATYWRCLLVLSYNYGFDIQQIVKFSSEIDHHLRWKNVSWAKGYPGDDAEVNNAFGWLWFVRQKTARKRPAPIIFAMSEVVRDHLLSIAPPVRTAEELAGAEWGERPIFPFPRNRKTFGETWSRLCELAGVAPKPSLDGKVRTYSHKHFRNTASTYHNLHIKGSASLILGHARETGEVITLKHYDNPAMAMVEAMKLPQPAAFSQLEIDSGRIRRFLLGDDDPQGWLFR